VLLDPSFTNAAASVVTDGVTPSDIASPFLASFPYLEYPTPVLTSRVSRCDTRKSSLECPYPGF